MQQPPPPLGLCWPNLQAAEGPEAGGGGGGGVGGGVGGSMGKGRGQSCRHPVHSVWECSTGKRPSYDTAQLSASRLLLVRER